MNKQIPIKEMKQAVPLALNRTRFKCGSWLCWLFLLCLFMGIGWQAKAADNELINMNQHTVTNNGDGTITFKILFFDAKDADEYTKLGKIALGKDGPVILQFTSKNQDDSRDDFQAYLTPLIGCGETLNDMGNWMHYKVGDVNKERHYPKVSNRFAYLNYTWHYPAEYEGQELTFYLYTENGGCEGVNWQTFGSKVYTKSFQKPTLTEPRISTEVGKYELDYRTNDNPIKIWKNEGPWVSESNAEGTLLIDISDKPIDYTFKVKYQLNEHHESKEHSATKKIPAFHMPVNFTAEDTENGNTLLKWEISNLQTPMETGDQFEIQRSNNKDFTNTTTVGLVNFNPNDKNYQLVDNTGSENLTGMLYYRIRRTKTSGWGWVDKNSEKCEIDKQVNHRNIASAKAERHNWESDGEGRLQAKISWELEEENLNSVWTEGSQIIVKKMMDDGNRVITDEITATQQDIENGYIIDDLNTTCVKYTYDVYVKPGSVLFPVQVAVKAVIDEDNPIIPTELGKIVSINASKGYYPDYTSIEWQTDGKPITEFEIRRREYKEGQDDDSGWATLHTSSGTQTSFIHTDRDGQAGMIYEYRVYAITNCVDERISNPSEIVRGFRSPTGTISGQVLFSYGDAVSGAEVRATPNDPSLKHGQSIYFKGSEDSYMETMEETVVPDKASIQLFVKPNDDAQTATLLSWGHYAIGISNGKAAISANCSHSWIEAEELPTDKFTQLTAVFDSELALTLYVNGEKVKEVIASNHVESAGDKGKVIIGKKFNGYLDEIRLWNRVLTNGSNKTANEIKKTYNSLLNSNEKGLTAYWRFDDPITDEAYDISHTGSNYNKNHAYLHNIELADLYPEDDQLSLRTFTDTSGSFQITGVPYIGTETSYTVMPIYPGHTFNPSSRDAVLGSKQPIVTLDPFTDNSAILIQGSVFYENSSIPVKGATFTIDDTKVKDASGEEIKTTTEGKFSFSVPVGVHTVKIQKANHTFRNGGRLLDENGENYNYQDASLFTDVRFWDETKVKLIGRVAGGTVEQNKPLGFSLSKNNLGDSPTLKFVLEGDASSEIYDQDVAGEGALAYDRDERLHYDGVHKNAVVFNQHDITITPDPNTGEFEAMLFPVKYKLEQATVTGWDDLMPSAAPTIDLSNVFAEQTSEYTPVDEKGNELATQTISYNEKFSLIHRVKPTISYKQGNEYGAKTEYFGLEYIALPNLLDDTEVPDTVFLYDRSTKEYLFKGEVDGKSKSLAVFTIGPWGFHIEATEDYPYNGIKTGENAKIDRVPTQGGDLKVYNTLTQDAEPKQFQLDNQGKAYIELELNKPLFANNNAGRITFSVEIDGETHEAPQLYGTLLGTDPDTDGVDFVTAGPSRLLNILRDPPGSASYSWWESGQSYTYMASTSRGMANVGSETSTVMLGVSMVHGIGVGIVEVTDVENENNVSATVNHEVASSNPSSRSVTITTNNRYQTSDDPLNVGSAADVFIGYSNNIYYGAVNEIELLDKETYEMKEGQGKEIYLTAQKDGKTYYICKGQNLGVSLAEATLFSYPKMHIENILIPNLEKLRNDMLFTLDSISESELQAKADRDNRIYYLSTVKTDSPTFGKKGNYKIIWPTNYEEGEIYDPLFKKNVKNGTPDSIMMYNNAIEGWISMLKQNEDEKIAAFKEKDFIDQNRSFHASSPVEYSESYEIAREEGYEYEFMVTAGAMTEFGFTFNKAGMHFSISEEGGQVGEDEQSESTTETSSSGFVLADEGDFDYISVDVLRAAPVDTFFKYKWDIVNDSLNNKWGTHVGIKPDMEKMRQYGNFVFRTRGGATACPYEPAEYTQYQYGTQQLLNEATLQIERPDITVDKPVVTNVPSDQPAIFNLKLMNDSQVSGATAIFTIAIVDAANQKGAKFSIDGVPLGEGRGIEVPYGEVLNKVLEVRRGTEYDYENLALVLKSQCQSDPTDNQADIADTVYISAHFIPSSSDINIKSPTDKWTLNTNAPLDSATGKYYMPLTIDGFDVNFQGFHHIEVQYKASSEADTRWTNICSFFTDTAAYEAASGTKTYITGPTISTRFFGAEDQNYDIRAVTFSKVGNEFVTKESPIITGVKDTKQPVVFGNIEPADGVLGVEDEIRLTFNEPIAEGYMTDVKNFRVTGVRNGSNGDHSTAITFDGRTSYLETQVTRNLEAKDVTVEMWINPASRGQDMTLFSHGDATNALELTLAKDNTLKVCIGESEYASKTLNIRTDEWQHVAMSYRAANQQLSVYFGGQEVVTGVQTVPYSGVGPMNFGRSLSDKNYFAGQMHEVRVWTKVVEMTDIIANALRIYTGREAGLTAYYPMKEGKGDMVTDKAQGATAYMYGATWSTQDGKSIEFNGDNALMVVNTSRVALKSTSDYTLEFWFKAAPGQKDAALVANGKGVGEENNGNADKVFVGFADGELVFRNNGQEQKVAGNFADGAWHHFVLTVNRTAGNAQIFMDGVLNSYFDATKVGGFSATELYAGARRWTEAEQMVSHTDMYLDGAIDELRIWNMALPASTITNNYNVSPEGTEMGLMMYLPFSKYITNSANIQELVYSAEDLVTDSTLVTLENAKATSEVAPVCKKAPETSIPFTFVVNNDALVINLMDTPEAIEKTTVNFTVKDVSDLNGNLMESPVTWSAYIDRNQLKWSEKQITKEKKLNATMTFAVDVENHGGTVRNFKIEGLPAWLDAMPESGTIDPQGRETILFTVDEGTNVGRYDEVVYVKGDNNVAEALPITLKVFDEQPDWTVNPGDFKYNMNIYGRVRFNKQFSADAEDMLATFDASGRCIGVANSQYLKENDMWYVFMTVYSNTNRLSADQIEFRSWDASTGLVYTAYPSVEISFESDKVWGTASAPIVFDGEECVVQNIDLIPGWNWISYNVANELFSDPASILSKAIFNGDEQVKDETNGLYMTYDGARKQWVNNDPNRSLKFDNRHMFLLQSPTAQKLSVSGMTIHEKENLTLDILPNWNYISYLSTVNLPISEALAGFEAAEGDIIKSQDRFSMYGETTGWLGSLTYLEPGKGYMLFSKNKTSLTYPDVTAGTTTRSGDIRTRAAAIPAEEPVLELAGRYAANMSVVATVADNMPLHSGDRLLAYANGELRGEALVTERPSDGESLFFLNVGGDRNEGISFALERSGEIIAETSPMLDYAANSVRGNIEQPMIIDFVNDLEISVYPNPFEHELNFILNAQAGDKVEIMLYTMAGQLFHHYQTTAAYDGYIQHRYETAMDMSKGVYMAVVVVNGKRHVYKVTKR